MTTKSALQSPPLELVTDDGEPMDSPWHFYALFLLIESTRRLLAGRRDYFTGGNMFVYYSLQQARAILEEEAAQRAWEESGMKGKRPKKTTFRGPDYLLVLGVDARRERAAWVAWEEEGRYPDLILELLSPSTRRNDLGPKKKIYEQTFRTREYVCFDPKRDELLAWRHDGGAYQPIEPDGAGRVESVVLGGLLGRWDGVYHDLDRRWLRLFERDGTLVQIPVEVAESEQRSAEAERQRAEAERRRAEAERQRAEVAEAELARLRARLEDRGPGEV